MTNGNALTAHRLDAARWLADRAFGKAVLPVDLDLNQHPALDISMFSTPDLEALLAIVDQYSPDAREMAESGRVEMGRGKVEAARHSRQR